MTASRRSLADRLYFAPLNDRLTLARELAARRGAEWARDDAIATQLDRIREAARALDDASRQAGIDRLCTDCGRRNEDGCCQPRMSDEASGAAYLVEILAFGEPDLPHHRDDRCPFIGDRGCVLRLKPFICVNHLCPEVRDDLGDDDVIWVQRATGRLLASQVALEEALLERMPVEPAALTPR